MKSIDGLKSRDEKQKTITVKKTSTPIKKPIVIEVKEDKKETLAPQQTREEFLEPVKSFDMDINSEEIKEEIKNESRKDKKKKNQGKKHHTARWIFLTIFILLAGAVTVLMVWGNDIISKITGGKSGIWDALSFISEDYVDLKTDENGRTNILIFGTSGFDMNGTTGNDGHQHDGSQLTDSIMVVSLDQKTGDVAMTSMPRDLKAGLTCTATGKINEVYWCNNQDGNDEKAGADALRQKMEDLLDIQIQYYAHVNWETVSAIVDAVGGITVTLDFDIDDRDYTGIQIPAGVPTNLTGIEAVNLARARHGTIGGDFTRGDSQQKILMAIKDKAIENGVDLTQALNIINSLGDNLRTDISLDEIKTGIHLLEFLNLDNMRQVLLMDYENDLYYLKTANINGISYVIPAAGESNYGEIQKYIDKMFSSDPTVYEDATIEILNGTEESGVAAAEKEKLKEKHITATIIGDAPEGQYEDTKLYDLSGDKPGTKSRLEDFYDTTALGEADLPEGIQSNCDFVIVVGK